jgi:transposase
MASRGPLVYDNLRSAVLERAGTAIRFHPRLLELAGHYHFAPRPCTPYRANEKGKIERRVGRGRVPDRGRITGHQLTDRPLILLVVLRKTDS